MTLEKMKYQLKDWYEGTQPNYVGKKIQGVKGTITNYSLANSDSTITIRPFAGADDYREAKSLTASQINGKKILYQLFTHVSYLSIYERQQQTFLGFTINTPSYSSGENEDLICWVKLNDILKMGGYWHSLYTKLCSAFRKAVVG